VHSAGRAQVGGEVAGGAGDLALLGEERGALAAFDGQADLAQVARTAGVVNPPSSTRRRRRSVGRNEPVELQGVDGPSYARVTRYSDILWWRPLAKPLPKDEDRMDPRLSGIGGQGGRAPFVDIESYPKFKEERARMAQSEDVGDLIRYIACLPPHIVINEVMINPTWNRSYVANLARTKA